MKVSGQIFILSLAMLVSTWATASEIDLLQKQSEFRGEAGKFATPVRQKMRAGSGEWDFPVVYVSTTSSGVVNVFRDRDHKPKKSLYTFALNPGVANSLQVDKQKNLFLADSYSTWVFEYAPGTNTPFKSFPTKETPFSIAVRKDTLYSFESMQDGNDAIVEVFEHGSTSPKRVLTDGAIQTCESVTVDADGNVFVAYQGPNFTSGVGEFVKGRMPMVVLPLSGVALPIALAIDKAGDLVIDDASGYRYSVVRIFPPGSTTASMTIPKLPWFTQISFTESGDAFYAGDTGIVSDQHAFAKYAYPSGTPIYEDDDLGGIGISGIAAAPAVEPGSWGALGQ